LDVFHAFSLVAISPVASLSQISKLSHKLLLRPNDMAAFIAPLACICNGVGITGRRTEGDNIVKAKRRLGALNTRTFSRIKDNFGRFKADIETDIGRSCLAGLVTVGRGYSTR